MMDHLSILHTLLLSLMTSLSFGEIAHYYIYEEDAPGTVIAVLSDHPMFNSTERPATNFRLMKQFNNSVIHVQESDGQLTIGETIDREKICRQSPNCILALDVISFSKDQLQLINVKLEVRDINDNRPHFPSSEMHVDISESSSVGTRFPLQIAIDEDIGTNSIQNYELSSNSHFAIDVLTRVDGVKYVDLVLIKELDRESTSAYTLELVAMDGGSPSLSGNTVVNVRVLDFNDNSPAFEKSAVIVDIMEDAPVGYILLDLNAEDPDEGSNGEIIYSFSPQVSPEVRQLFKIDSKSGGVTLEGRIDFEIKQTYEFDVQAQDLSPNPLTANCKIIVNVIDVNDNAPTISITPLTSVDKGIAYISESSAMNSFVALISTTDKDSGSNSQVHCTLYGHEHFKLKQAYDDSFMIVTTSGLDREKIAEYNLTLVAEDLGFPSLKTIKQYTIRVSDENDNAPQFTKQIYELSLLENNPAGAYITALTAKDPDFGLNCKVSYKLVDAKIMGQSLSTFVAIDAESGVLRAVRSLDYEKLKQLDFEVESSDNGELQLSTRTHVKIKIIDENDNAPVITFPFLDNGLAEVMLPVNAPQNYLVLQLKATDKDDGLNGKLIYSIVQDNQRLFTMNRENGELTLTRKIDSLQDKDLSIKIAVYDSGKPPLKCNVTITFILTDSFLSNVEVVIMQTSAQQHQMDLSIVFIAVLAGGCALILFAILFVACSCKNKSNNSKTDIEDQMMKEEGKDQLLSDTTKKTESSPSISHSESCQQSLNTESENCSLTSISDECKDLTRASQSSESAFLCPSSRWQCNSSSGSISVSSQIEHLSAKDSGKGDSGKGDSDFIDSDSDASGESGKKDCCITTQKQTSSTYIGNSSAYQNTESQFGDPSSKALYPGNFTMQYEKGYSMSYSLVPTYNSYQHHRIPNVHIPHYALKESYYHSNSIPDERMHRQCGRDLISRQTTLSPPRLSRRYQEKGYNPPLTLQPCEIATTF
ncbi:protocadherin-8-like [Bufo gargarizans]|uniref:protocadherin-8-like n=1 Tax=Bufo gargarizans TaxID=30331 RepID=UPI001CF41E89|nr:protocadherin-8-like [Bufo gargarizans]